MKISYRVLAAIACLFLHVYGVLPGAAETAGTTATASVTTSTSSSEHAALIPVPKNTKRFAQLHQSFLNRGKEGPIDLLFLGDSITERWSTSGSAVWKKHYAHLNAANFGIGGDRTQHVLWRIANGELDGINPRVLVLLIGTNNTNSDPPEPIIAAVTRIVEQIRVKLPNTRILLLGILPRNAKRQRPENAPMKIVPEINRALAKLDNGTTIRYLDLTENFLIGPTVSDELMPDGVHLNEKGYKIWATAMEPLLMEMLRK